MICRARILLPLRGEPIVNGAVIAKNGCITAVGPWADLSKIAQEPPVDFGDAILLPGLINAHCHLDYTLMAGKLPAQKSFADWIKGIVALKAGWCDNDFYQSWISGAQQSLAGGVTTLADIEAIPALISRTRGCTPLRVLSFAEVIGLRPDISPCQLLEKILNATEGDDPSQLLYGLSPHAPYTTTAQLLQECGRLACQHHWLLTMHISESREEYEMFMVQRGPLHDWLRNQRSMKDCDHGSPLQFIYNQGIINPGFLAVHMNYLGPEDIQILARQPMSVAHCPRSHDYFQHQPFPYDMLKKVGVNICLGTDSLASTKSSFKDPAKLDLFAEMRTFRKFHPNVDPETIIRMATVNGAQALRLERVAGQLSEGFDADMIAIPYSGAVENAYESVLEHRGPVLASIRNGRWIYGSAVLRDLSDPTDPKRTGNED